MLFTRSRRANSMDRRYELRALCSTQGEVKAITGRVVVQAIVLGEGPPLIPGALPFPEPFVSIEFRLRTRA
jgi:hypothetical protein